MRKLLLACLLLAPAAARADYCTQPAVRAQLGQSTTAVTDAVQMCRAGDVILWDASEVAWAAMTCDFKQAVLHTARNTVCVYTGTIRASRK